MAETDRLTESTDWIDLEFVQRERTPRGIIEKGIRYHLAGLSLSNTVILLEELGVIRSRTAIHNWVQKADLQPRDGESPDRVAVDQKSIRINDEQYWLYAAVDPATNRILHSRLFPTYTIAIAREFLTELAEKHDIKDAVFLIDDADDLIGGLRREGLSYRIQYTVIEIRLNVSSMRQNDEPLRFQTVLATSIQPPQKRGYKPTPSGGIMLKLTRPIDPALGALILVVVNILSINAAALVTLWLPAPIHRDCSTSRQLGSERPRTRRCSVSHYWC